MKYAVLVCELEGKKDRLFSVADRDLNKLMAIADKVAKSGVVDIGEKSPARVVAGQILADGALFPKKKFRINA